MGSVIRFAAINTKIKVLEGQLLSEEQYSNLVEKKTYQEAIRYLKEETSYSEVLSNYNGEEIPVIEFQNLLKRNYTRNFEKIMHYFNGNYKKLLKVLFMRYVIEDLKVIIRCKYIGKKNEEIYPLLCAGGGLNSLDYKKLVDAKDLQDFVEHLGGTSYYNYLQPLINKVNEEGLFRVETALDSLYFPYLRKYKSMLDAEDKKLLSNMIGTYSDLINLQWIIRGKTYYKLKPEIIFNYVIQGGLKFNQDELKRLCYAKDVNEILELIDKSPYKALFNEMGASLDRMDMNILLYFKKYFKSYKKQNRMNLALVLSYIEIASLEVRDIISIVENIRYGANGEEIKKFTSFAI